MTRRCAGVVVLRTMGAICMAAVLACGGRSDAVEHQVARTSAMQAVGGTTPADAGPIMDGDHSIIRTQAVGPLHVGEWRRRVMSFVYAVTARAGPAHEDVILVRGVGKDTVSLTFQNDTLRRVFITRAGPHTTGGLGVGVPFANAVGATGATTSSRGTAKVMTLATLCGVQFSTDSLALSPDSIVRGKQREPATIRAISIGYCKQ